ncbi:Protein of unknown function DUF262 [Burkholderia sp. OK233]|nr:Protein of unknown function DUF262 [Burkholderia sp. OK233]
MNELDDIDEDFESLAVGSMVVPTGASDRAIEKHFESGRLRVVQEKNDIFMSHIIDFIKGSNQDRVWGNLRPEYQRRLRWDTKKKSKLIESFIMNVPVPPVFLYEKSLGKFEVMDGQQRLNAVAEFMSGEFALEGLEIWQALNGRTYSEIPPLIRRGLERAKISAITLMSDSSSAEEDSLDLRAQVFERLNTGGERLNAQELRNSLYSGPFNELLIELSKDRLYTDAWGIPNHQDNTRGDGTVSEILKNDALYKRMTDVEIVLRFFAFEHPDSISGSVRAMLDSTMKRNRYCNSDDADRLRQSFRGALSLCVEVFRDMVFCLPAGGKSKSSKRSRPLFDAEMVAMSMHMADRARILEQKDAIRDAILKLVTPESEHYALMVGRGNTAATIKDRISKVYEVISDVLNNG